MQQSGGLRKRSNLFVISLCHILSKLCGFLRKHIAVAVVKTAGFSVKKLGYDADMLYHANVELVEEARILEAAGIDEITLMDSAGCMFPDQVSASVEAVKRAVKVPIGFHCHANMGMCSANAVAAYRSGADILDCGLLGMARSAGNMPTELATALMQREGECRELDFYGLLHYLDQELIPAMGKHGYKPPLMPRDLILGYSGCHSAFVKSFTAVAGETGVDLYQLIVETSALNRKNPSEALMREVAAKLA